MNIPEISTHAIELDCVGGVPIIIPHGLGRQLFGYDIIWKLVPGLDLTVVNPGDDTSNSITLLPSATGKIRLVLL